jgi:hypothetical protein
MVGTIVNKKILDRLQETFKRYGRDVLGDPDIAVEFFPTEYEGSVGIFLASPNFQKMPFSERQNSVWDYLRNDSQTNKDDIFVISRIATETEAVEFI